MNLGRLNRITVEDGRCGGRPCISGPGYSSHRRASASKSRSFIGGNPGRLSFFGTGRYPGRDRLRRLPDRSRHVADFVKFLVGNQLPSTLAPYLQKRGFDSEHVLDVGLDKAWDIEISAMQRAGIGSNVAAVFRNGTAGTHSATRIGWHPLSVHTILLCFSA
jgi:hypothetical protein